MNFSSNTNDEAFSAAQQLIPGGVNSPVRSFNSVGGTPFFTDYAKDCYLYDIEQKQYIDYVCSWGANIAGHANAKIINAVTEALHKGFSFGAPTLHETNLAAIICNIMPNIQKIRLVNSGTEAVMSAIRLTRGYTKRKYIVKFNGCYHGHTDSMLIKSGSGTATFNNPNNSGVTNESIGNTLILEYNNTVGLENLFTQYTDNIAGVIIEPFAGNMNLVMPNLHFMKRLRELTAQYQAILIFDEVMTGFRVSLKGAQDILNIKPDLTILGKIIGAGMPIAAFGGRADIMDCLSPLGAVYQAGTLSGNPIAVVSGISALSIIQQDNFYTTINNNTQILIDGLNNIAKQHKIPFCANYIGGMFGLHFQECLPSNLLEVQNANEQLFKRFFHLMLDNGIFIAPSMYEAGFISICHTEIIIKQTLEVANQIFAKLSISN